MNESNYIGKKIGYWTVLEYNSKDREFTCICICGRTRKVHDTNLTRSKSKSCGCQRKTQLRHGLSHQRPYQIWRNMLSRCSLPCTDSYKYYGARGIKVCDRWKLFDNFWADMNDGYDDSLTIDRIDVNGNYEPGNCRWATTKEQAINRRGLNLPGCKRLITFNGKTMGLKEWADHININYRTLSSRINNYHWSIEKALTQ